MEKDPIDVPCSVTVLDVEMLADKRLDSVYDTLENTSNVDIISSSVGIINVIKIRGVGPLSGASNIEDTSVV